MAKVFVCASTKGGVSKTTTTVNLAAAMAEKGYRCLLVDFDPQGQSGTALNITNARDLPCTLVDVIAMPNKNGEKEPIEKAIYKTEIENLDLAVSYLGLSLANLTLSGAVAREKVLAKELRKPAIENKYDFVFIDTNPATDILLINALGAADYLIACSKSEYSSLDGVEMMLDQMRLIKDTTINPDIKLFGVMISHIRHTGHDRKTMETIESRYPVLGCTPIRTEVNDAFEKGTPVVIHKPDSDVSKAYKQAAEFIIQKYENDEL